MAKIAKSAHIAQMVVMRMMMENVIIKNKDVLMKYIMDLHVLIYVLIKMKIAQNVKEMEIASNVLIKIIMVKIVYHVPIAQEGVMKMKMENVIIKMKDALMDFIMDLHALIYVLIKMQIVQNV